MWRNAGSLGEAVIYVAVVHTKREQSIQNGRTSTAKCSFLNNFVSVRCRVEHSCNFSCFPSWTPDKIEDLQLKIHASKSKINVLCKLAARLFPACSSSPVKKLARRVARKSLTIAKISNEGK